MTPHEDDHDHEGHDHEGHAHGHAHAPEPAAMDLARYEGVDGFSLRIVSPVEREVLAVVPAQRYEEMEEAAAREMAKKVSLKGFRPGKVPPARVRTLFAREVRDRAIERLVQDTWQDVLQRGNVRPVANPRLSEISAEPGQAVRFALSFEVLPDVALQGLDSVTVSPKTVKVTDKDVDAELDELRAMRAELLTSDAQEASPGDFAVIDLARWLPGSTREGEPEETGRELLVEVAHEKNLPELDKALLGMGRGETRSFDAKVTGPEGEAGQLAPFRVTLHDIRKRRLPELDDAFAQSLGGFEDVAALRATIRERLVDAKSQAARREQEAEAMDQLVRSNPVQIPPSLIEQEAEARIRRGLEQLSRRGVDVQSAQIDFGAELAKAREVAERDLRADYLLEIVARERGVDATDDDVQSEIQRIAASRQVSPAAVRAELEKAKQISNLRATIRRRRTLDLLRSGATISVE
jgi:trigger factor